MQNRKQTSLVFWLIVALALILPALYGGLVLHWHLKPLVLWTDLLVYILVACIIATGFYVRRREHMREPWRQVLRSKMGMASLVVLLAYVSIGLLDSIHFRKPLEATENTKETHYSGDVYSVLDFLVLPIRDNVEKTYSAPFSTHLFAKETVEDASGAQARIYPRLAHGGIHLADPQQDRTGDVVLTAVEGFAIALLLWAAMVAALSGVVAYRRSAKLVQTMKDMMQGKHEIPWQVIFITLGVLSVLIGMAIAFAPKYHVFGTDKVGQDVFYQSIKSIRTGLLIGTLTTLIMLPFAVLLGIMAGYFKGWIDDVIQYTYTTLNSIPGVLLIAAAVLMMQVYMANHPELFETDAERADFRLFFLCIILGITSWTGLCRMLRGEALKLREMEYVQASSALGVKHFKIILRHIQPNVMHIVLIAVVLDFSGLVLAEAVLSYVGVGVDPTMHSWGNMINSARLEMAREPIVWWSLLAAFLFMFVLVLAANLFSDAVRDAFDPRIRKQ